jgi:hypothetical protein
MFRPKKSQVLLIAIAVLSLVVFGAWQQVQADPLAKYFRMRILLMGWNVESGGSNPAIIAKQLEAFEGYDIIGLCEVRQQDAAAYAKAAGVGEGAKGKASSDFQYVLSTTGGADRMMIIWDNRRLEKIGEAYEIIELKEGNHRAPLFAKFQLRGTDVQFLFMVNHLARINRELCERQAKGLSDWAATQSIPVIAVGDYNIDYDIDDGVGSKAFNLMLEAGVFEWVVPNELVKTQLTPKYNGVLDFFFIAHKPSNWRVSSRILDLDTTGYDKAEVSDHRPVRGRIIITPNQ